jgi:hypothetical protein
MEAISSDTIKNAVGMFKGMRVLVGVEVNGEQMSGIRIGGGGGGFEEGVGAD